MAAPSPAYRSPKGPGGLGLVVYGDLAFLVNAGVDGALLVAAGLLGGAPVRPLRLGAAASAGGLYGVGYYLAPTSPLYGAPGTAAMSLALVVAAFHPLPWPRLVRVLGWLWLSAASLAGLVLALSALGPARAPGLPWAGSPEGAARLAAALGLVLLLAARLRFGWRAAAGREVEVTLAFGGPAAVVRGLVDSGNRLRDPLSGAPCLVAEAGALGEALPAPLREAADLAATGEWGACVERLAGSPVAARVRLVPYRALGNPGGMMLAVFAERAELRAPGRRFALARPLVALSAAPLDRREGCQALVPEALVAAADDRDPSLAGPAGAVGGAEPVG